MILELSDNQARHLIHFIDIAVKVEGLKIAGIAYDIAEQVMSKLEDTNEHGNGGSEPGVP